MGLTCGDRVHVHRDSRIHLPEPQSASEQRVHPTQARKAAEIGVGGMQRGAALDAECGEMRVGREVARRSRVEDQPSQNRPMVGPRIERRDEASRVPAVKRGLQL
jgi:hypothetical protein